MITIDDIGLRISKLRLQKNVSAKNMSLLLGMNEGYISKLENSDGYPTMKSFFYICEYFDITPMEFFDFDNDCPTENKRILEEFKKLDYKQTKTILEVIKWMHKK